MTRPIIFLDVDGVLNDATDINLPCMSLEDLRECQIHEDKLHLFAYLVHATNARVVISSTWREAPLERGILYRRLEDVGIVPIGDTPQTDETLAFMEEYDPGEKNTYYTSSRGNKHAFRGYEILKWLHDNGEVPTPFVAIDDNPLLHHLQALKTYAWLKKDFVQTNPRIGLSTHDVDFALTRLEAQT